MLKQEKQFVPTKEEIDSEEVKTLTFPLF